MKFLLAVALISLVGLLMLLIISVLRFRKEVRRGANDDQAGSQLYFVKDLMETVKWLGLTREESGIPEECMEDHIYLKAGLEGELFGQAAYGSVYFSDPEKDENRKVQKIHLYTRKLTFPACREYLKTFYEEPKAEGNEPFIEVNGGELRWAVYETEGYRVRLSKGSARSYVEIAVE